MLPIELQERETVFFEFRKDGDVSTDAPGLLDLRDRIVSEYRAGKNVVLVEVTKNVNIFHREYYNLSKQSDATRGFALEFVHFDASGGDLVVTHIWLSEDYEITTNSFTLEPKEG